MGIKIENISKIIEKKEILKNISLNIENGEIFCLLGRNGSGKSTLINILSDLTDQTSGNFSINGIQYSEVNNSIKYHIGLQSQYDHLIEELNLFDFLFLTGKIYGMKHPIIKKRIQLLTSYFFEENNLKNKLISTFSSGMKKKTQICAAFLHKPDIVFLDEPFNHLDPLACDKLCNLILSYINDKRVVFISSHDLLYVKNISTTISILEEKEIVYIEKTKNIVNSGKNLEEIFFKYIKKDNSQNINIIKQLI